MQTKVSLNNPLLDCVEQNNIKALTRKLVCETPNMALIVLLQNYGQEEYCGKIANFLIASGANPNVMPYCHNIEIAKILLSKGADINLVGNSFLFETFLHAAIRLGDLQLIKFALENGADINVSALLWVAPWKVECIFNVLMANEDLFNHYIPNNERLIDACKLFGEKYNPLLKEKFNALAHMEVEEKKVSSNCNF